MALKRVIVAITGASGAVYGIRMLEMLQALDNVETHLVVSAAGWMNVDQELERPRAAIESLATVVHSPREIGASIASGSFECDGMIVAPCSMKTLASIAVGLADNLVSRAADVMLKERRRLVLLVRETPLNLAHLRNMTTVTEMGAIVFPPVPAFYHRPSTIAEIVDDTCERALALLGVDAIQPKAWRGLKGR